MRLVLLRMDDEAAANLAKKSDKVLGVWDFPSRFCKCPEKKRNQVSNWYRDEMHFWPRCKTCHRVSEPFRHVGSRLKMALGRNIVKQLRDE